MVCNETGKDPTAFRVAKETERSLCSSDSMEVGERGDGDGEARGDVLPLTPRGNLGSRSTVPALGRALDLEG